MRISVSENFTQAMRASSPTGVTTTVRPVSSVTMRNASGTSIVAVPFSVRPVPRKYVPDSGPSRAAKRICFVGSVGCGSTKLFAPLTTVIPPSK